ncbi:MAG: helix-turn-helix transcriptional regulator [Planctomycetes bacterium]|nr:helix-turn-helix transcriptional regulator [Planctomycetota bacterium]
MNRNDLFNDIERGQYSIGKSIYMMRRSVKVNRIDFAKKIGISKRTLEEIEQGRGNPTLKTLEKILSVFNFEVTLRRRNSDSISG